jgi:hypothetical protein
MMEMRVVVNGSTAVFNIEARGSYCRTDIYGSWERAMWALHSGYTADISIGMRNILS